MNQHQPSHSMENMILAQKYRIIKKLGSGSFGQIFLCEHAKKKQIYAVKIEKKDKGQGQLQYQIKLYQVFSGIEGIAQMIDFGLQGQQYFLVMELLGESLEDLLELHNRKFSLATVFNIGIQIVNRLQAIHRKGFIHRDIKANNFMIGKNQRRGTVYIIDFGLAKRYIDSKTGTHIPLKDGKSLVGTARYASIASHQGKEQGRKDDLQSLGFLLLYFARGKLPWQGVQIKKKAQKYAQIGRIKKQTPIQKMCTNFDKGSQIAFVNYFAYVRSVRFNEQPNYQKARSYFKEYLIQTNQYNKKLDWIGSSANNECSNGQTNYDSKLDVQ